MRGLISQVRKLQSGLRDRRHRNLLISILDGVLVQLGTSLSHPSMVLALLVRTLGGGNTLVGTLSTIRFSGSLLPQVLIARRIQSIPRKGHSYL